MSEAVRVIKKYPNRRLYDTATSSYITLADVKKLVLENVAFKVEDAKTHDDLTRSILLQIILEEESAQGAPMFSCDMLTNVIRFYGNTMQGMMGNYLDKNIQTFIEMQKRLQDQSQAIYGNAVPPVPNANAWADFLKMQGPTMQGLMGNYLEQSASAFIEMQRRMESQTRNLFGNFPFPNFAAAGNPFAPPGAAATAQPEADAPKDDGGKKDGA
jgi:polyhydroxyalkanoate synthesis repressor PhaR